MWSLQKTVVGYIDIKQQEKYEKLKKAHSKLYWYFINATTTDDNNDDDNTPASFVTATATSNKSNNNCNHYNNDNVIIIITMIITIKIKSGCALKEKIIKVAVYVVRLISYSVKKMFLNSACMY